MQNKVVERKKEYGGDLGNGGNNPYRCQGKCLHLARHPQHWSSESGKEEEEQDSWFFYQREVLPAILLVQEVIDNEQRESTNVA